MAYQRWRKRRRDSSGRRGRLGWVGVAAALALILGCSGDLREPTGIFGEGDSRLVGAGNPSALVGEWENVLVVRLAADVQTTRTVWLFGSRGRCRRTVETLSLVEGVQRRTERDCSYSISGTDVAITFNDAVDELVFPFSIQGSSRNLLVLGGFEFTRLA